MALPAGRASDLVQTPWPFIGRDEELQWADAARRDGSCGALVVRGIAGVGKTRLAREALRNAAAGGAATEWVQATHSAASIPLGAFAELIPSGVQASNRVQLFGLCADALRARAGTQRAVLGVDDAHLLDPTAAALVHHLAATRTAFVVATVRSGERCPDSIVALWKELEAPLLDLQRFSMDDTARVLSSALGGEVAPDAVRWAFTASDGHVLYLRELVKGALRSGALEYEGGTWRLRSQPQLTEALAELISNTMEGLSDEELTVARLLALGEPLRVGTVTSMVGMRALSGLEEKGLATIAAPGASTSPEMMVRLSHPLYGEALRAGLPTLHGAELRVRLAETVRAGGLGALGDRLRVATWLEEAGAKVDEPLLLAAARDALAVCAPDHAERLARRAPRSVEAALIVASAYIHQGRFVEAEAVLGEVEGELATRDPAIAYVEKRATTVLAIGLRRHDEALGLLDRAEAWFDDAAWLNHLALIRAQILISARGGPGAARAVVELERVLPSEGLPSRLRTLTALTYAMGLKQVGRAEESRAITAELRPTIPLRNVDDVYALMAWWGVRQEAGYEWDESERWLAEADAATAASGDARTRGEIVVALAWFEMRRGRPVTAAKRAREAIEILEQYDPLRRLPLMLLVLVICTAMQGDAPAARAALDGYEAAVGDRAIPYHGALEATTRAAVAMVEGESSRAAGILLDAAADHERDPLDHADLLHEALRAGVPARRIAPALGETASRCDAPLVQHFAELAAGVAAGDGAALLTNAEGFGEIGAWLWAAESAALAADVYAREALRDSARRALSVSAHYQGMCERVWSPILAAVELAPTKLTVREREIVTLAANGASNAEIARRLVLSVRTVEAHLYRAMQKLGVNERGQLRVP
jgi:DNA-binding CsgD family transcriptional regulator